MSDYPEKIYAHISNYNDRGWLPAQSANPDDVEYIRADLAAPKVCRYTELAGENWKRSCDGEETSCGFENFCPNCGGMVVEVVK